MANFFTKSDLSSEAQAELTRILAISSARRTSYESNFLTARNDYIYNEIIKKDSFGYILEAQGHTIPTGLSGFQHGAIFRKTDDVSGTHSIYENTGDTTTASWNVLGTITSAESTIDVGSPVNATNAVATVTASSVADGDTLTIGSVTYRAKTTPAQAYDVALGANDAAFLDNLKLAINASGVGNGSDYYTGTLVHPTVTATTNTDTTQVVSAITAGSSGNSIAVSKTGSHLSWDHTTLTTGVDGTVGTKGEQFISSSYIYTAVDNNTVADKNWRRVSLGSAY